LPPTMYSFTYPSQELRLIAMAKISNPCNILAMDNIKHSPFCSFKEPSRLLGLKT
jgi:hypothetical protein